MSGLENKINHTYIILTTTVNKTKDEDVKFGEYIGESKFQDRKTKAWIRHNISNILYQAECGGAGSPIFPLFNSSQNLSRSYPQHQYPGPGYNQPSSSSSSSPYLSPLANNQQQVLPLELQTNQEDKYNF